MIVIGEKINGTRKSIARAIQARDSGAIKRRIKDQDDAGADFIDLNVGTGAGGADIEIGDMCWLIDVALEATEKKLSIDSANPLVIRKAAEFLDDRRPWLINSVKDEKHILEEVLPVAANHGVPVIALAMDAERIPADAEGRIQACRAIGEEARKAGIEMEKLFFDPLVMPLSSNYRHGKIALETLRMLKGEFPQAKTTMGLSNISFGLPRRSEINQAFLIAAISHGLDSAICDPTIESIRRGILLGRLIAGKDRHCRRYTRTLRKRG